MSHITPTPGRIVLYRGADGLVRPAIVTLGRGPFSADLFVFGRNSTDPENYHKEGITHADPDSEPGCLPSWHWMPYQKQQAEKHAAKVAESDTACISGRTAGDDLQLRHLALDHAMTHASVAGGCRPADVIEAAEKYLAFLRGSK